MKCKRYYILDAIRGFTLLNMILYHAIWDIVYIFHADWQWYRSDAAYLWQQSICWTFILLSGFCQPFGKARLKRGLTIFLFGLLLSAVTLIAMPENRVIFGILTLFGSCSLLMLFLERILEKCRPAPGLLVSTALFILTRNIAYGHLGFEEWYFLALPKGWYSNLATAYLGFPSPDFFSTDYFPLFPWSFLFVSGYFLHRLCRQKELLRYLEPSIARPIEWLGQHSLILYLIHQPVIYLLLTLLFSR